MKRRSVADLSSFLGGFTGSTIGQASVKLYVDNAQYNRDLAASKASLTTTTGTMSKSMTAFKQVGTLALLAVGVAAVKFAAASVQAAIEAQQAQTKLANSIENATEVGAASIPVFNAQAEALRKLTGADDEAITASQALLVQMGLTQGEVSKLTPLIVDLSTKFGVDMETAAKAVGKSVNGTTAGLSKMGVVVDKTAAETDAYAATLEALGVVQGFAAQKAEDEPWTLLASTFEELQEQVGEQLLPGLQSLAAAMVPLAEDIGPLLSRVFEGIAEVFEKTSGAINALHGDFQALMEVDIGLLGSIIEFIPGMQGVGQAVQDAQAEWEAYRVTTDEVADSVPEATKEVVKLGHATTGFALAAQKAERDVKKSFKDFRENVKSAFDVSGQAALGFKRRFEGTVQSFARGLANMRKRAEEMVKDLKAFNELDLGSKVRQFFLEQGPDAIHHFVDANKGAQKRLVDDAKGFLTAQNELGEAVDEGSRKVIAFKQKVAGLKALEASVDVIVNYHIGSSGVDPTTLPGLGR
jgi:hypothetical protein